MLKFKDFLSKKRFVFVGDIMQHPEQLRFEHETGFNYECFDEVMHLWSDADYVFGNLETTLAGFTEPPKDRAAEFVAPDEFIISLKRVGFTHLSLCNNHMYDKGVAGFKRTIEKVREAGIVPVYGKVKVDDFEVMNFTTHLNKEEDDEFMKIPPHDEKTIAISHWGGQ